MSEFGGSRWSRRVHCLCLSMAVFFSLQILTRFYFSGKNGLFFFGKNGFSWHGSTMTLACKNNFSATACEIECCVPPLTVQGCVLIPTHTHTHTYICTYIYIRTHTHTIIIIIIVCNRMGLADSTIELATAEKRDELSFHPVIYNSIYSLSNRLRAKCTVMEGGCTFMYIRMSEVSVYVGAIMVGEFYIFIIQVGKEKFSSSV